MVKNITDEMLCQYMPKAEEQWIRTIDAAAEDNGKHIYSERFQKTLKKQIRYAKRSELTHSLIRFSKKAASFVLLFGLISFIGCMSVKATRTMLIDFVKKVYSDCTDYMYSLKDEGNNEFRLTEPDYIPEGYTESEREKIFERGIYIYYATEDASKEIEYNQVVGDGLTVMLDTEGAMIKRKDINGIDVEYFTNKDVGYVYWTEGNCYYRFMGPVDVKELLKMAESIIRKEK